MILITDDQIQELQPYIYNIDKYIQDDDIQGLLDAVDDVIISNILKNNDEPDKEGVRLQGLYDDIYYQNWE